MAHGNIYALCRQNIIRDRKCVIMLETARERVALMKAGIDGKTIEHLYIRLNNFKIVGKDPGKMNCWEFVGCGREPGGDHVHESGICKVLLETSADGRNGGKIGGRICWDIAGTYSEGKIEGVYAKKLLSCRSCSFFKKVKDEEGASFSLTRRNVNNSIAEAVCCI